MACSKLVTGLALLCVLEGALAADPPHDAAGAQATLVDGFGQPVSAGALQHYSGSGLVQNNQTITGTVSGNSASNVSTGANSISGNAFQGATGLPSVVQNTGNNVLIQTGVIVNVQLKP